MVEINPKEHFLSWIFHGLDCERFVSRIVEVVAKKKDSRFFFDITATYLFDSKWNFLRGRMRGLFLKVCTVVETI